MIGGEMEKKKIDSNVFGIISILIILSGILFFVLPRFGILNSMFVIVIFKTIFFVSILLLILYSLANAPMKKLDRFIGFLILILGLAIFMGFSVFTHELWFNSFSRVSLLIIISLLIIYIPFEIYRTIKFPTNQWLEVFFIPKNPQAKKTIYIGTLVLIWILLIYVTINLLIS